jgi:hypothetical protein
MPAGNTYTQIASTTLTATTNEVNFTSIPSTYTDLVFVIQAKVDVANDLQFEFNADAGTNYSYTVIYGTGSSAGSYRASSKQFGLLDFYGTPDTTAGSSTHIMQIMNYANTTTYKTALSRSNRASGGVDAIVNLWRSTAAINRVSFYIGNQTQNFLSGSTLNLYGITAA